MNLEKTLFQPLKKAAAILTLSSVLFGCPSPISSKPDDSEKPSSPNPPATNPNGYDYTTTTRKVASQNIESSLGGSIKVTDPSSYLFGTKLTIPQGALSTNTQISVGEVNNPPELPKGLNYVGSAINFEPDGINFNQEIEIQIPYHDNFLSDAGISDENNLKLYSYNKSTKLWEEINISSLDTTNNILTAKINHFSYYAIAGLSSITPSDLGIPLPGDLLYTRGAIGGSPMFHNNWMPGHVGIYVGEKVFRGMLYNVIEALPDGITRTYYNPIHNFSGANVFMGAREPNSGPLTSQQREIVVNYAELQVGKPYAWGQTALAFFGMLEGKNVKGPNSFNCVGLAEKAYELAGVNEGMGLVSPFQEDGIEYSFGVLTPAEQYNATRPASGKNSDEEPLISGEKIIFQSNRYPAGIYIMNADGTSQQLLIEGNVQSPKWNKTRDKIVYVKDMWPEISIQDPAQRYEIFTANADGSNQTRLTYNTDYDHYPCWSQDGTKIVFESERDGLPSKNLRQLYIMNSDGNNQEKILDALNNPISGKTPCFSSDGTKIIYGGTNLYSIELSNKNITRLVSGSSSEISCNSLGDILFNYWNNFYILPLGVSFPIPLIFSHEGDSWPSWSKDESKILFSSQRNGNWDIYSVYLNGKNLKNLTKNSAADISSN